MLVKNIIEKAHEADMKGHLNFVQMTKGKKTIKSGYGTFYIDATQEKQSSFEPEIVKK